MAKSSHLVNKDRNISNLKKSLEEKTVEVKGLKEERRKASQMMNAGNQNSRSSSLDDLTLQECPPILSQESGRDDTEIRNCIRESYYQKSNTLPINGSLVNGSKRVSPSLQLYGSEEKQLSQNAVEGRAIEILDKDFLIRINSSFNSKGLLFSNFIDF